MKKYIKNKAEKEKLALGILDTIDDSYISEALELHMAIVDSPEIARSPKLFMKRIAVVAACFLVVLAIIPVALMMHPAFDKGGDFEPALPEQSMPNDALLDGILSDNAFSDVEQIVALSPGQSVETALGIFEFVSFSDGVFTFGFSASIESAPRILLVASVAGIPNYSLNFDGEYAGQIIENGFTTELTVEGGESLLRVDSSLFIGANGASPYSLRMLIFMDSDTIAIIP